MSLFKKTFFTLHNIFEILFCIFLFLLPWQTVLIFKENSFGNIGIFGFEILFWFVTLIFLVWFLKGKIEPHKLGKAGFAASIFSLVFLVYIFLAALSAPDTMVAFFQAVRITEAFVLVFILAVFPFEWPRIAWSFIVGVGVQSLLGIYQFLTQSTFAFKWLGLVSHPVLATGTSVVQSEEAGRWLRAYGALPHPNVFGGFMVMGIIFTTLLFQKSSMRTVKEKILFLSIFFLQIAGLFFSFSRSAWIAALLWVGGWLIYSLHHDKKVRKPYLVLFLVFFLGLCALYFPIVKTRLKGESYHEVRSIEEREAGPRFAFELWKDHRFLGVGGGNYIPALREKYPEGEDLLFQPVHVMPLLFLTEYGIIGFLLFVGIWISLFFYYKRKWFLSESLLFGLPILTLLFFDHYLYSLPVGIFLFAVYVGCIWQHRAKGRS